MMKVKEKKKERDRDMMRLKERKNVVEGKGEIMREEEIE